MADTKYAIYDIQLMDRATGMAIISSGGKAIVVAAGLTSKSTLANPDSSYAALTNPISATRGKFRFAIAASPNAASVDLYGTAPGGQAFQALACKPGTPTEVYIDTNRKDQMLILPFLGSDYTAASENDFGLDLPAGAVVEPHIYVKTTVLQAKTFDFGLLSSESGGDADGFLVGASLAALGTIVSKYATTVTAGALVKETATGAAAVIPCPYVVAAAVSPTITPASGTTTGAALISVSYRMPAS